MPVSLSTLCCLTALASVPAAPRSGPVSPATGGPGANRIVDGRPAVRLAAAEPRRPRRRPVPADENRPRRLRGIWISREEILKLPTEGQAWEAVLRAVEKKTNGPNLSDQDDKTDVVTLARALVAVRTDNPRLAAFVRATVMKAMGTEEGGRTLALGRNLAAYVIAADLVGLEPRQDARFRTWLREILSEELSGKTLRSTHEDRPNNWGTVAGGSRAAVAVYLGDERELRRTAEVFRGWLGDRSRYAGFDFGKDRSWHADPARPLGVNPKGAQKDGRNIDGALPDDMRRGGPFQWPPEPTGYPWGALQGAVVQAEILHRAGYDAWQWEDRALLRAVQFLYRIGWEPEGDDAWIPWLIDARYGTDFATNPRSKPGKIMGWTAWTHGAGRNSRRQHED